jgi:hypothetical protein
MVITFLDAHPRVVNAAVAPLPASRPISPPRLDHALVVRGRQS